MLSVSVIRVQQRTVRECILWCSRAKPRQKQSQHFCHGFTDGMKLWAMVLIRTPLQHHLKRWVRCRLNLLGYCKLAQNHTRDGEEDSRKEFEENLGALFLCHAVRKWQGQSAPMRIQHSPRRFVGLKENIYATLAAAGFSFFFFSQRTVSVLLWRSSRVLTGLQYEEKRAATRIVMHCLWDFFFLQAILHKKTSVISIIGALQLWETVLNNFKELVFILKQKMNI